MDVDAALSEFDIGRVSTVAQVGSGNIHRTWRVTTDRGVYVLQKLHDVISDTAVEDMAHVTEFVATHGINAPKLMKSRQESFVVRADGARWRLYPWIDGDVFDALSSEHMAEEAGHLAAKLHSVLKSSPYQPKGSIPHFHDTEYVLKRLHDVSDKLPDELRPYGEKILIELPHLIVRDEGGPMQLIHGDLKISNFIFSKDGSATGIIDFDTILVHHRTVDIGDALRSWCNKTSEDDPSAVCDPSLYDAAIRGFSTHAPLPTEVYRRATQHIALELAARFLTDVVEDAYFGWNQAQYPSRKAHNTARVKAQCHLADSLV